jgi:transcription antitermination factor NusG
MLCRETEQAVEPEEDRSDWHALYTRHQHEKVVARALSNKGFEIFLPLYEEARRWSDRLRQLTLPLFPCYVFLRGGLERRADILMTPGARWLVGFGTRPAAIPSDEIDAVRQAVARTRIEPHPFLRCGDWVRVESGPLEGIEGILLRKKNLTRLVLSVGMLQRAAALEIDAALTKRIPPRHSLRLRCALPEPNPKSAVVPMI